MSHDPFPADPSAISDKNSKFTDFIREEDEYEEEKKRGGAA
jgi:hypothetical protein